MKTLFAMMLAFAASAFVACDKNNDDDDDGVLINGVKWATRNVDAPGTFAASSESAGMFYQWNRKVGWSSSDPMINSDRGTIWDSSTPSGTEWEKANDPCPSGWRIPTSSELSILVNSGSSWTTKMALPVEFLVAAVILCFFPPQAVVSLTTVRWSTLVRSAVIGLLRSMTVTVLAA
jgi:hypothetical protein